MRIDSWDEIIRGTYVRAFLHNEGLRLKLMALSIQAVIVSWETVGNSLCIQTSSINLAEDLNCFYMINVCHNV